MTPKLFKVAEVCELVQVQPYVLRSWEKEFRGIGIQKSEESQRLYRQSDVEQVLRIKQLVFGEGLTVAGARRRIEESDPSAVANDAAEVIEVLGADARKRIGRVRDGLRSLLEMLDSRNGHRVQAVVTPQVARASAKASSRVKPVVNRGKSPAMKKKASGKRARA